MISIEEVQADELERMLQGFYDVYPERRDVNEYVAVVNEWKNSLQTHLVEEMIEAIAADEFFFHRQPEIWQGYLDKQLKKTLRPSVANVLETWRNPRPFIGKVNAVNEAYLTVKSIFGDETIQLRRESEKPVPVDVHLACFLLPDGTSKDSHYLAVSYLVFFPTDHAKVFDQFVKQFDSQKESVSAFLKENGIAFWKLIGEDGYDGGEFTNFEAEVLLGILSFLEKNNRETEKLTEVVEDYLVEKQPKARKAGVVAAGAIRFGQENELFEPLGLTVKEIAESFNVSPSSLNTYYNALATYYSDKK